MGGLKFDEGKLRWDLIPWKNFEDVVRTISYGAVKYGSNNWQDLDDFKGRYFAAAMRHIMSWHAGEDVDEESGLPHLAHATCCLLFLMHGKVENGTCEKDETPDKRPQSADRTIERDCGVAQFPKFRQLGPGETH